MDRSVEDRVEAIADAQHRVVTLAQLMGAGVTSSGVSRRTRAGRLHRLYQGVYLVGSVVLPWTREKAAALAAGPHAAVSHTSALPLVGLSGPPPGAISIRDLVDAAAAPIHISTPSGSRGRQRGLILHRVRDLRPTERTARFGIPVTTPARTILDVAGLLDRAGLERVVARAERDGLVDRKSLTTLLRRFPGRPGTPVLREILVSAGGPALIRSEAEDRFRALAREARLPPPHVNVRAGPYELDFFWPEEKLAVEIDGFRHHSSHPRFLGDRRKDSWLLARGITVLRLSWQQITEDRLATAVEVGRALALAAAAREGR